MGGHQSKKRRTSMMLLMGRMGGVRTAMMSRATIARRGDLSVSMRWFVRTMGRPRRRPEDEALRVEKKRKFKRAVAIVDGIFGGVIRVVLGTGIVMRILETLEEG
jgi:hypothetical protein